MATEGEPGAETPTAAEPEASTPNLSQPHLAVQDLSKLVSRTGRRAKANEKFILSLGNHKVGSCTQWRYAATRTRCKSVLTVQCTSHTERVATLFVILHSKFDAIHKTSACGVTYLVPMGVASTVVTLECFFITQQQQY